MKCTAYFVVSCKKCIWYKESTLTKLLNDYTLPGPGPVFLTLRGKRLACYHRKIHVISLTVLSNTYIPVIIVIIIIIIIGFNWVDIHIVALIVQCIWIKLEFGKCWFLQRGENRSIWRKTSRSREENQQQTQPTYSTETWNRTRATLLPMYIVLHCKGITKGFDWRSQLLVTKMQIMHFIISLFLSPYFSFTIQTTIRIWNFL